MRAAVQIEPDRPLELRDLSPRPLRTTEVHVRIDASGVCHSDETIRRQGMGGLAPVILGHEGCGTVLDVGGDVRDLSPGDRVIGAVPAGLRIVLGSASGVARTSVSASSTSPPGPTGRTTTAASAPGR